VIGGPSRFTRPHSSCYERSVLQLVRLGLGLHNAKAGVANLEWAADVKAGFAVAMENAHGKMVSSYGLPKAIAIQRALEQAHKLYGQNIRILAASDVTGLLRCRRRAPWRKFCHRCRFGEKISIGSRQRGDCALRKRRRSSSQNHFGVEGVANHAVGSRTFLLGG
jgi:hypothetical protein